MFQAREGMDHGRTHVIGTRCRVGLLHWIQWVLCLSKKGDEGTRVIATLVISLPLWVMSLLRWVALELMGVLF